MLTSDERAVVTMASESTFDDTIWRTLPTDTLDNTNELSNTGIAAEESEAKKMVSVAAAVSCLKVINYFVEGNGMGQCIVPPSIG
jgi:hypothetical protein